MTSEPAAGYTALRSGAGLVAHAHDLVWVSGPDCVSFLDGSLSQDIAAMEPGTVARSLLLEPRGKMRAALWLLRGDDRIGILSDPGTGAIVSSDLERFRFRVEADVASAGPVAGVWGAGSAEVVATLVGAEVSGWVDSDGLVVASVEASGLSRFAVAGAGEDRLLAAGAVPAAPSEVRAVRIEAGEPAFPDDLDESVIPQESGLVPEAVSFTKGCYLGQELVARIDSRGHVNRRLVGFLVAGGTPPPPRAQVLDGDAKVGSLGSAAHSAALGGIVALGLLRREVEAGAEVTLRWDGGEADALVRDLPLEEFASR